jgi:hypothetical protein
MIYELGIAYISQAEVLAHNLNLVAYVTVWVFRLLAWHHYPLNLGDTTTVLSDGGFVNFLPYVSYRLASSDVNSLNAFLCWFKLIHYLSLVPDFAAVTNTLAKAAKRY